MKEVIKTGAQNSRSDPEAIDRLNKHISHEYHSIGRSPMSLGRIIDAAKGIFNRTEKVKPPFPTVDLSVPRKPHK